MGKVGIAFLPAWGAGHLISMVEMAKRLFLARPDRFSITVLLIKPPNQPFSSTAQSYMQSVSSSALDIHFHDLPPVEPPKDTQGIEDFVSLYIQSFKPHVKAAISGRPSSTPVSALFVDFFATTMIDVANELNIPTYVYFTSTAALVSLMLHLPILEEKIPMEFEEFQGNIEFPGISPVPPLSMPTPFMNKKNKCYTWFVYHGQRFLESKGIIINTFEELESKPLQALAKGATPPIYPVGPVLLLGETNSEQHECIKWLDQQPPASVVFLCFGSMGCFDATQTREMASGLEQSGHRFLWCLRSPPAGKVRQLADANLEEALPEGFSERIKGKGLVWPSWVPQAEILSHKAVGGFVTHCGWNSCLESLCFGVPMLAWPLYAEQNLNAFELVKELGLAVGMEVDRKAGGWVGAAELARGVRCLMGDSEEGNRVRGRVEAMRSASRKAVEEGGSSSVYLERLAAELGQEQKIV